MSDRGYNSIRLAIRNTRIRRRGHSWAHRCGQRALSRQPLKMAAYSTARLKRGEPLDLPVNGVIAGWTEALLMMQEGDKWKLIVPPGTGLRRSRCRPDSG